MSWECPECPPPTETFLSPEYDICCGTCGLVLGSDNIVVPVLDEHSDALRFINGHLHSKNATKRQNTYKNVVHLLERLSQWSGDEPAISLSLWRLVEAEANEYFPEEEFRAYQLTTIIPRDIKCILRSLAKKVQVMYVYYLNLQ